MENVFTTLEHTIAMISATGENRDFSKRELQEKRDRLLQAIAAVLEDSLTTSTSSQQARRIPAMCDYHSAFVQNILEPKDKILSFNYDCLLDYSLKEHGNNKWHPRYGYGLNLGPRGSHLEGDAYWTPTTPAKQDSTARLFKLHGSLHFNIGKMQKAGYIKLKQRPYTKQNGNVQFTIIPPEWNKSYAAEPFKSLWQLASSAIREAEHIVVIGYSLPPTDLHSVALFRTSLKKAALKSLVVVNPDQKARRRIRTLFHRGLSTKTKILSFDYLSEFVASNTAVWR